MITLRFVVDEQTFLTLFYTKNKWKNNVTIDLYMVIRTYVQQFCALATLPFYYAIQDWHINKCLIVWICIIRPPSSRYVFPSCSQKMFVLIFSNDLKSLACGLIWMHCHLCLKHGHVVLLHLLSSCLWCVFLCKSIWQLGKIHWLIKV